MEERQPLSAGERETPTFQKGLRDGIPICLGYISVSFTFGMMAAHNGLPVWMAMFISATNLTSAGQFAGTELILSGGMYLEVAVTTLVINLRYLLMSLSLSQKVDEAMTGVQRWVLSFGITDEIFAVAVQQRGSVGARYLSGLILTPYFGWLAGTFLGAAATGFLPESLRGALGIAIYGMFLAIIVPPAKKSRPIAIVVAASALLSCLFQWMPGLRGVSGGWVLIICAVVVSGFAALRWPMDEGRAEA